MKFVIALSVIAAIRFLIFIIKIEKSESPSIIYYEFYGFIDYLVKFAIKLFRVSSSSSLFSSSIKKSVFFSSFAFIIIVRNFYKFANLVKLKKNDILFEKEVKAI
jgi:hypothetical protein